MQAILQEHVGRREIRREFEHALDRLEFEPESLISGDVSESRVNLVSEELVHGRTQQLKVLEAIEQCSQDVRAPQTACAAIPQGTLQPPSERGRWKGFAKLALQHPPITF